MIDISKFFDLPNLADWQRESLKTLKLETTSQLEDKLNKKSFEGFSIKPLYLESSFECLLKSFPSERRLLKADIERSERFDIFKHLEKCQLRQDDVIKDLEELRPTAVLVDLTKVHNAGASIVQELALCLALLQLIEKSHLNLKSLVIEMSCDSLYFNNIAKLRALRFICESLAEKSSLPIAKIQATSSLREQTLYDPWVNMLRQTASTAAGFIGGADYLNIFSYDEVSEFTGNKNLSTIGKRHSENVFHILNEESFLSLVKDPSSGSNLIESLTFSYISESFELFRHFEKDGGLLGQIKKFSHQVELNAKERRDAVANTEKVIPGLNEFANTEETLNGNFKSSILFQKEEGIFPLRRTSIEFEKLRFSIEDKNYKFAVVAFGSEAKLSARIMFCSNFIESLGHPAKVYFVKDVAEAKKIEADVKVLCALDDDYSQWLGDDFQFEGMTLIAGKKVKKDGLINIYQGLNKLNVLQKIVEDINHGI